MKPIDKIIDILPIPVLVALASVFLAGWVIKEIKGFPSFGPVIQNPVFQSILLFSILATVCFYGVKTIFHHSIPNEFSDNQRGIYVSSFDREKSGKVQLHTIESLKTEIYGKKEFSDVKIAEYKRNLDFELAKSVINISNASLIIYGKCLDDKIVHFNVLNGHNLALARYMTDDFPKINKVIDSVLELLKTTPPKSDDSSPQIEFLKQKLLTLETQYNDLDKKYNDLYSLYSNIRQVKIKEDDSITQIQDEVKAFYKNQVKYVIAIGINDYSYFPSLRFAKADAMGVAELYNKTFADRANITVLLDKEASKNNILNSLNQIVDKSKPNDQVVIFFAGQGITSKGTGYIIPSDSQPEQIETTAISMQIVGELFKKIQAEQTLMVVDACYSGAFDVLRHRGLTINKEIKKLSSGKGKVVITAGTSEQAVAERADLGHGLFTYYLLKGLSGEADFHQNGFVTVTELFYYLQETISKASKKNGFPQTPTMFTSELTDYVLTFSDNISQKK